MSQRDTSNAFCLRIHSICITDLRRENGSIVGIDARHAAHGGFDRQGREKKAQRIRQPRSFSRLRICDVRDACRTPASQVKAVKKSPKRFSGICVFEDMYRVLQQYRIRKEYRSRVIEQHYDIIEYASQIHRSAVVGVAKRGVGDHERRQRDDQSYRTP